MSVLMWFREDLRITDNPALYHASKHGADEGLIAIYIISPEAWHQHDIAPCRVDFLLRGLRVLSNTLEKLQIPLLLQIVNKEAQIPSLLLKLCHKLSINQLFFNRQYEVDEVKRDATVTTLLSSHRINVWSYDDQTIISPGELKTQQGKHYTVFTPFKRAWFNAVNQEPNRIKPLPAIKIQRLITITPSQIPDKIPGFNSNINPERWPAGEVVARKRLAQFVKDKLLFYNVDRDFPAREGTSQLSPYLTAGMISAKQCLHKAIEANGGCLEGTQAGASTWINELVWRDFYKHVLVAFPRVCRHQPFKLSTRRLNWDNDPKLLLAWQQGQTGFPLIDAAMRQLNQTGWMHNRLRMVVAMFLSKLLWLDWRCGEQYFMQHLMDGDVAANNGGWQWCASTGTDAVPYFRIFNPVTQSEKFDPEGEFIRQFCPELAGLDNKLIHQPYRRGYIALDYPEPIIDYNKARKRALAAFKNLGGRDLEI